MQTTRVKLILPALLLALGLATAARANEAPVPTSELLPKQDEPRLFSFKAVDLEIKQALALFAEANDLNILPDRDVEGNVTTTFKDLPLETAMAALLDAHGYYFTQQGGLIRVRNFQTRLFRIDYINTIRVGSGSNDVQFSSRGGDDDSEGSSMSVTANATIDFWESIREQLQSMISEEGSYTVNSLAGVVSVTERYARMAQIAQVLEQISEAVVRQVELEVEIYEVVTDDTQQLGIDWTAIQTSLNSAATATGSLILPTNATAGGASGAAIAIDYSRGAEGALLEALSQQGELKVLSRPKLRTLNNQPAVIRVGQDLPVFRQTVTQSTGDNPILATEEEIVNITIGTVLSITPQISVDGMITLDVTPAVSRLLRNEISAVTGASAPVIDVRQSSSIVRIPDGATVVLGGLVQTQSSAVKRKIPLLGDIPGLGKAFQGTRSFEQNNELVIVLTPTIIK